MQTIVFASQKGGSGKTTLAAHMAVQAGLAGFGSVAMVDTDPQGSLHSWWKMREEAMPALIRSNADDLPEDLERLRNQGHRLAIIDTQPAVTEAISEVVRHADLVVIPCRPSPHDLRAVGATVDIVEQWQKHMIFVVNSATRRARITSEAAVALSQHGTVAPATLHHRVDFAASMIDGRTVMETGPDGKSANEIITLWDYIESRMGRINQVPMPYETAQQIGDANASFGSRNQPAPPTPEGLQAQPQAVPAGNGLRPQGATFGRRFASDAG
ncbi:MAG: ParA family protein [Rhodospirillaceae bacterium]|jgi:chromosome partitioning protein|nr:ParA family protein [Rhodospirillaceae bacterium]MBT4042439.1 ParA family protein [Rhodospirillaceae bacterium]MBT4691300.1 ParA family protein [Rhodospirillaceae bacterium]MBT5081132.1 ParA family protein [Rhodospirillaceae bacterium]MBT5524659.1 ParA family protein [Rhodospirillaceae bacterium]